jgi:hypothetical protein
MVEKIEFSNANTSQRSMAGHGCRWIMRPSRIFCRCADVSRGVCVGGCLHPVLTSIGFQGCSHWPLYILHCSYFSSDYLWP